MAQSLRFLNSWSKGKGVFCSEPTPTASGISGCVFTSFVVLLLYLILSSLRKSCLIDSLSNEQENELIYNKLFKSFGWLPGQQLYFPETLLYMSFETREGSGARGSKEESILRKARLSRHETRSRRRDSLDRTPSVDTLIMFPNDRSYRWDQMSTTTLCEWKSWEISCGRVRTSIGAWELSENCCLSKLAQDALIRMSICCRRDRWVVWGKSLKQLICEVNVCITNFNRLFMDNYGELYWR